MSHKKSIETDKVHLRWLNTHLSGLMLDEINKTKLDNIKQQKLPWSEPVIALFNIFAVIIYSCFAL